MFRKSDDCKTGRKSLIPEVFSMIQFENLRSYEYIQKSENNF